MEKETKFLWAWYGCDLYDDPSMTRERASRLLRSYRKSETHRVKRTDKGRYRIIARGYETEPSTMVII